MKNFRFAAFLFAAAFALCAACRAPLPPEATPETARAPESRTPAVPAAPDYARAESWAALPAPERRALPADVFYVYPTIFGGNGPEKMDTSDEALRARADVQIRINGGVFAGTANLFAPYYRQASIELVDMDAAAGAALAADGFGDVRRAFRFYLRHLNGGRPFILAGFSQGSMALLDLMKTEFSDPRLRERLVAAYLIGWSFTREDAEKFPWLKPARGETDLGVIVSYNTQLARAGHSFVLREGAFGINPVNWKTDGTPAPASAHKGAVIFDIATGKILKAVPHFSSARLEEESGALVVEADPAEYDASQSVFPAGVMHMYDYMFFYENLKENVRRRTDAWFEKNRSRAE